MLGLPIGVAAVIVIILAALVSILILTLVKGRLRFKVVEGHNDITGFIFATVGVLYAVVLAFVVIAVWERFGAAEEGVAAEAALTVMAYRDTQLFSEPERTQAQQALRTYMRQVTDTEWESHGNPKEHTAPDLLNPIWAIYWSIEPQTADDERHMDMAEEHLHELELARHERHLSGEETLPYIYWVILLIGAGITIFFAYIFQLGSLQVHSILTGLLTGLIAAVLILIFALDRPFTGDIHVSKQPFTHALEQFNALDHEPPR